MMTGASLRSPLRVPRFAVLGVFFVNGVVIGTWVVRIPAIKEKLGLGEGLLGVALLGAAVGALVAMPIVGALVSRLGSRRVVGTAALLLSVSLLMPALAPNLPSLVLALVMLGAANGGLDVAMNAQAVAVERGYGRPIMSSFHAAWSFGGLAGAALGGLSASQGIGPLPHFSAVAVFCRDSLRRCLRVALALARRRLRRGDAGVRPSDSGAPRARHYLVLRTARRGRDG